MAKKVSGMDRVQTGIPGLDQMLEGGFIRDSSVLIRGDSGTAKTLFCLQYLHYGAVEKDEPGLYLSFAESREATYAHGSNFNWDLENLNKRKRFTFIRYEPHEVVKIMEDGGGMIRDTIDSMDARRLVVDSLTAYALFFENKYKANQSILSLFELLNRWKVTTLVTSEFPSSITSERSENLGFLAEGIIDLYHFRHKGGRMRAMEIVKMRDTNHSQEINRIQIEKKGLKVCKGLGKLGKL